MHNEYFYHNEPHNDPPSVSVQASTRSPITPIAELLAVALVGLFTACAPRVGLDPTQGRLSKFLPAFPPEPCLAARN